MPSIEILVAFTLAAILMNISPGPSNLYVMARSIAQGTQGGIIAALGLAVGSLVHVVATVLGLSAIFKHSPMLYTIIKLLGAGYLLYLGYNYWKASKEKHKETKMGKTKVKPLWTVFYESVIVEVTNPKTALFFIAFLPQFVVPESGSVATQLLILGIIVTISAIPCDLLVALFSSKVSKWIVKNEKAQVIQERVSGSILMAMGTYIIADEIKKGIANH